MKKIGYFVGVAVAAFALSNAQAVELVAEWTDFTGLTDDTPLRPSRGVEAGEGGVWTLSLNGGSVQDGALFTGTGAAPAINFNGKQHQIGGTGLGGFTVVVEIEPATSFVANKPIWMFHEAGNGANGQGIALTAASQIRGIWGNAIWDKAEFPATDIDFTTVPSIVVTTCGGSGTAVYWNGTSVRTAGSLRGGTMGDGNSLIYFGNFHDESEGGNNFKISRIAVFDGILSKYLVENDPWMENTVSINVANGQTYEVPASSVSAYDVQVAAGGTLQFDSANLSTEDASISAIVNPTFNTQGTIKIANAASLQPGNYLLMDWEDWPNPDLLSYGKPSLVLDGYTGDMSRVRLVPEVYKLWLQIISDEQAARPVLTIEPIGDSITEGLNNAGGSGKNYRIPLLNKLSLAGYNVASVGYWNKSAGGSKEGSFDPSGDTISDPAWTYHSGKGSMRAFKSSPNGAAMYDQFLNSIDIGGEPDVVLMHIGINDMIGGTPNDPDGSQTAQAIIDMATKALASFPKIKFVMSSPMCNEYGHSYQNKATEDATSGNDCNKTFVTPIHTKVKEFYEAHKDDPEFAGRLFFADLYENVMPRWYGNEPDTFLNDGSDHCHPNWLGHEKMAQTWFEQITTAFPDPNGPFNSENEKATYAIEGEDANLGAAANVSPEYIEDFRLVRVIEPGANQHFSPDATREEIYKTISSIVPYTPRIAYYVEFVRDTSTANVHRWVWADMDAFSTIDGCGLPNKATVQQVVNNLHIDTNHPAVEKIPATTEGEQGFIEFTPFKYSGTKSTVSGAPTEWFETRCGYNDTMESTGDNDPRACMQLHRIFKADDQALQGGRQGQVVFAYNNWGDTGNAATEFGIGNFDQTFTTRSCDWTYMTGFPKVNATSMSVRRIEIWAYAPHRAPSMIIK